MKVNMPIAITTPHNNHCLCYRANLQIYIDKGKISLLVLLDLSQAFFYSVNHDLLLNKLVQLNIDSTWFASYLHDRTHANIAWQGTPIYMEYPKNQYLVKSSLTFLSMTFLKLINYQKLQLVQPFMQTMFNSCSVTHLIISSSKKYMQRQA